MLFVIQNIFPCLLTALALGAAFGYFLKKMLQDMIPQPAPQHDFSRYALKADLPRGEFLTAAALDPILAWKSQVGDPKHYARQSDLPEIGKYTLKSELPKLPDLSGFALKSELPKLPDLSVYAKKADIPALPDFRLHALKSDIPKLPEWSGFALRAELPKSPDLSGFALKTDIPKLPDLSAARVNNFETPDKRI